MGGEKFNGMRDAFAKVYRAEGLRGLYKGAASPVAGAMAHNAAIFFSYGAAKQLVAKGRPLDALAPAEIFTAGAMAGEQPWRDAMARRPRLTLLRVRPGVFVVLTETPVDLFKIKLQSQGTQGLYSSSWDAAKKV